MELRQFESFDEVLQELRERSDDFDGVEIRVATGPVGAVISKVGGKQTALNVETTERLLNDGILNRMRIPVTIREM